MIKMIQAGIETPKEIYFDSHKHTRRAERKKLHFLRKKIIGNKHCNMLVREVYKLPGKANEDVISKISNCKQNYPPMIC